LLTTFQVLDFFISANRHASAILSVFLARRVAAASAGRNRRAKMLDCVGDV
jgi:hypothetical protein